MKWYVVLRDWLTFSFWFAHCCNIQGLGKTVQTIVFIRYLKHLNSQDPKSTNRPHLVVVPSSVLENWEREFKNFAPDLYVAKYHGSLEERENLQYELSRHLPSAKQSSRPIDVILAPVTYFQKEKATERQFLRRFSFDYLIVDVRCV